MPTTALTRTPSRFARMLQQIRSSWSGPLSAKSPELARLWGHTPSSSGISVNETTAMNYSAVYAAINLISGDVSSLPLNLYKRLPQGGKERYDAHPLFRILHDRPNPEMTSVSFRRALTAHALSWGNAYAEIERDGAGRVKYVWPLLPDAVMPFRENGQLLYRVANDSGGQVIFSPDEILHIPGLGYDGTTGYSVISKARESIGLGIAAERFGGTFFGNGSTFGGILSHPGKLGDLGRKNLRESVEARHQGVDRAHRFIVLEEGMTYAQVGIKPDDAQFLETRQFQVTEIARWFNVPPHKIGDLSRATFSNIEQQSIDYFRTTLVHWLETWEQELEAKLISPLERTQQLIEHETEGLLRGDAQARGEFYSKLFSIGAITPNEIRSLENMNPISGGDTPMVPLNMLPLNKLSDYVDAQIEGMKPAPAPTPVADPDVAAMEQEIEEKSREIAEIRDNLTLYKAAVTEARADIVVVKEQLVAALADAAVRSDEVTSLRAQLQTVEARAGEHAVQMDALTGELAKAESAKRSVEEQLIAAQTAVLDIDAKREADQERFAVERDTLTTQLMESQTLHAEREQASAAFLEDRNREIRELRDTLGRATTTAEEQRGLAQALAERINVIAAERETAVGAVAALQKEALDTRAELDTVATTLAETRQRLADMDAQIVTVKEARAQADAEAAAQALARQSAEAGREEQQARAVTAEAELAKERETAQARMIGVIAAHRALIADVMTRMVAREAEKARKHQATQEKLRTWLESFYTLHEELCVEALLPAMRAHLAWLQSSDDPQVVTRTVVRAHIRDSVAELRAVTDSDPDEYPRLLERTLQRWETDRPAMLADALQREAISYVSR